MLGWVKVLGKEGGERLFTVMGTKCWPGKLQHSHTLPVTPWLFKVIIMEHQQHRTRLNPSIPEQPQLSFSEAVSALKSWHMDDVCVPLALRTKRRKVEASSRTVREHSLAGTPHSMLHFSFCVLGFSAGQAAACLTVACQVWMMISSPLAAQSR